MAIAVIHARGGSRRIPRKNVKDFNGKPMIAYPIQEALRSRIFDRVVVSTDCPEISDTAREYGAETPYVRPAELSGDFTGTAEVLQHDIKMLGNPEFVCCIYATSPFLKAVYLRQGLEILKGDQGVATSFSVTSFSFPVFRSLKINQQGCVEMFWPEYKDVRSQDLPEAYHDAGQFYWVNTDLFNKNPTLYAPTSKPVILPRYLVQDIDNAEDWQRAEYMHQALQNAGIVE